jgi:hypothetical protein
MNEQQLKELKHVGTIIRRILGWSDDDQEYIEDAYKSLQRVIEQAEQPESAHESGSWYAAREIDEMVRDLDVAMNGDGAAPQASLCDLMPQLIERLTAQPAAFVGLTDEDIAEVGGVNIDGLSMLPYSFARAIEAKLREKNGGKV